MLNAKFFQVVTVLVLASVGTVFSLTAMADSKPTAREEMNQDFKKRGLGGEKYEIDRSPLASYDYYMERLDAVKKKLKITDSQQALWVAYEKQVSALFVDLKKAKARVGGNTAPQQIGQVLGVTQNRYAAMENIFDASKKLYESLSDSQKKTADEMLITTVPSFD